MFKLIKFLFYTGVSGLLLACSHENPLEKNALSLSGKFLYQASRYAEVQLNAGSEHGGFDFGKCVEGNPELTVKYCDSVYAKMIEFAEKQNGAFKEIILNDLTDANVYYQVKGYYDNQTYIGEKNE